VDARDGRGHDDCVLKRTGQCDVLGVSALTSAD
jgi:hypothetical protein